MLASMLTHTFACTHARTHAITHTHVRTHAHAQARARTHVVMGLTRLRASDSPTASRKGPLQGPAPSLCQSVAPPAAARTGTWPTPATFTDFTDCALTPLSHSALGPGRASWVVEVVADAHCSSVRLRSSRSIHSMRSASMCQRVVPAQMATGPAVPRSHTSTLRGRTARRCPR